MAIETRMIEANGLTSLAVMGGRFVPTPNAAYAGDDIEWNWRCDPRAVQHVLAREPPTPYSSCRLRWPSKPGSARPMSTGWWEPVPSMTCWPPCAVKWLRAQAELWKVEDPRVALHNPLTAAVLVEPGLCTYRELRMAVDDRGVPSEVDGPANVRLATGVDADAFQDHLMHTLLGTP